MTTTVNITVSGNKAVSVQTSAGTYKVFPGTWLTLSIYGEQQLVLKETGDFIVAPSTIEFTPAPPLEN